MQITYQSDLEGISAAELGSGFFVGWTHPLDPQGHLELLGGSDLIELAVDHTDGKVVGYITALTDGRQAAFVPFLEVVASHQGNRIGTTLVRRIFDRLADLNDGRGVNVDLSCNEDVVPFYERFGMRPGRAMWLRPHLGRDSRPAS